MPGIRQVTVAVKEWTGLSKQRKVEIQLSEDPIDLAGEGAPVQIQWNMDSTSDQGWQFDLNGIRINGVGARFSDDGRGDNGSGNPNRRYTWTRNTGDGQTYSYLISVTRTGADNVTRTATWDPSIINQQ